MDSKKRSWTVIAVICAVIVVGVLGFAGFHHRQNVMAQQRYEERVHARLADMATDYAKVKKQKNDAKRLAALKALVKAAATYRRGDERDKQILTQYRTTIAKERRYFTHKNDAALAAATVTTAQLKAATKQTLQANDRALAALLKVVAKEHTVVYSAKQQATLEAKITTLRKSYAARLKQLTKAKSEDLSTSASPAETTSATTPTDTTATSYATDSTEDAPTAADTASQANSTATTAGTGTGSTGSGYGTATGSNTTGSTGYSASRYRAWTPTRSYSGNTASTTGSQSSGTTSTGTAAGTGTTSASTTSAATDETATDASVSQGEGAGSGYVGR